MTTPSHLRIWRGAGVAAAVIGSQSLVAALPQPGNALMLLPSEGAIAGLGDGLRRGFLLAQDQACLLYTSPSPRDLSTSRMPSSA